jgi:hypothetical protein
VEIVMATDAELMETSLIAVADSACEVRHGAFLRFFADWPERRATFLNVDAASRRMTDETLEMMLGLAKGEELWVGPLVDELAFTHRSYGRLPLVEYEGWVGNVIDELAALAGAAWDAETDAAWRRQGERLKTLIAAAREGWDRAMPGHVFGVG